MTLRRFWTMLAHYHGQTWNGSEIGRSLGEAHTTVRRHLDIVTGALVVRQLPPWVENIGKRWGFEFKYADAPRVTRSMQIARRELALDRIGIVYPGKTSYPLNDWAVVVPLTEVHAELGGGRPAS